MKHVQLKALEVRDLDIDLAVTVDAEGEECKVNDLCEFFRFHEARNEDRPRKLFVQRTVILRDSDFDWYLNNLMEYQPFLYADGNEAPVDIADRFSSLKFKRDENDQNLYHVIAFDHDQQVCLDQEIGVMDLRKTFGSDITLVMTGANRLDQLVPVEHGYQEINSLQGLETKLPYKEPLGGSIPTLETPFDHLYPSPQFWVEMQKKPELLAEWRSKNYGVVVEVKNASEDMNFYVNGEGYGYARYVHAPRDYGLLRIHAERIDLESMLEGYVEQSKKAHDLVRGLSYELQYAYGKVCRLVDPGQQPPDDFSELSKTFVKLNDIFCSSSCDWLSDAGASARAHAHERIERLKQVEDCLRSRIGQEVETVETPSSVSF